ncbi:MAG: hypothetical protein WKF34_06215 [Pyrinomonadaceae bacterium]
MACDLEKIYESLFKYCRTRDFAGYDPFDGLNSSLLQATPLGRSRLARLAWLQMVKRSPVDLRKPLGVKPDVNPKAIALFALAEMSRFRVNAEDDHRKQAGELIDILLALRISGETADGRVTNAFGYNFDWQSRHFFAPRGTPAIVPTAFASQALVEAFLIIQDERYLTVAAEICNFILERLKRIETDDEVCFSYTPNDETVIYNASLLAAESLAGVGSITGNSEQMILAAKAVRFVLNRQRPDGAWTYGSAPNQGWVDNFHTAYVLQSLSRISLSIPAIASESAHTIGRGIDYWINHCFLSDGTPKYYDETTYPVDIHAAAVAISVASEMREADTRLLPLARRVAEWTIENMLDDDGFFYYQKRARGFIKTPFMRWGQAWMAYALARLIEAEHEASGT